MNIENLNEKLNNILTEAQLNEMSMALVDRSKNICVWVENVNTHNNKYFKYYNSFSWQKATKAARISLLKPEYIYHKDNKQFWKLNSKEKKQLVAFLNEKSNIFPQYTKWQEILMVYNRDNFGLDFVETINGFDVNEYKNAFLITTPMPDYLIMD